MKTLLLTAALLGASASTLAAQSSNIWVANRGAGGSVSVLTPGRAQIKQFTATDGIATPWDVVYVPRHDVAVVSNNGNGTLTVIDARSFQILENVSVPQATNLRGLSVSGDENSVFVAGLHSGNTAVYQLALPGRSVTVVSNTITDTQPPEDCVVINASRVGGSGNGPGKVYYSVPGGNYIGVLTINPPGPDTSISLSADLPPNIFTPDVSAPTQLERTPDHSAVFAGCTTTGVLSLKVLRIVPGATDTADQPEVRPTSMSLPHFVRDIAFRPSGPPFRAFVHLSESGGTTFAEIDAAGDEIPGTAVPPGITAPGLLRFNAGTTQLFIGTTDVASTTYGVSDASSTPIGAVASVVVPGGAQGPAAFAFSPQSSAPAVSDVWPSGMVSAPGTEIEIRGANFIEGATVEFINENTGSAAPSRTVSSVSPGALRVNGDNIPVSLYEVRVTNPDLQVFRLRKSFLSIQAPAVVRPFDVAAPSRFEGYALRSVPQYLSAADLLAAVNAGFGGYNPSNIRIFIQNGGGYRELTQVEPGMDLSYRSFWILSRLGGTLTLSEPPVGESLDLSGEDDKLVILQPGWNMVTQPAFNQVAGGGRQDLSGVLCWADGALGVPAAPGGSLLDAATANVTSFPARFVNGAYVFETVEMVSGEGYWIRNNTAGPLYLEFLHIDATAKTLPAASSFKTAGASELPPPPPGAALSDDDGTAGCGLSGLELLVLLVLRRGRRAK